MDKNKVYIFSASRFVPDKDERGVIILDPRTGEYKTGLFEITLEKSTLNGPSEFVAGYKEQMSYLKYKAVREDIHSLSIEGLKNYFPELAEQQPEPVAADSTVVQEEDSVEELKARIAELEKNAKASTSEGDQSTGKTDAKESGSKDPSAKTKKANKTVNKK